MPEVWQWTPAASLKVIKSSTVSKGIHEFWTKPPIVFLFESSHVSFSFSRVFFGTKKVEISWPRIQRRLDPLVHKICQICRAPKSSQLLTHQTHGGTPDLLGHVHIWQRPRISGRTQGPKFIHSINLHLVGGFNQPIWKICWYANVKIGWKSSPSFGVKIKNIWVATT